MKTPFERTKCLHYASEEGHACLIHARLSRGVNHIRVDRIELWMVGTDTIDQMSEADIAFAEMAFNSAPRNWEDWDVQDWAP